MAKETILIVEDEADVRNLLQYNLEKDGYTVVTAATGEDGFQLALAKKPSAVLLDLMLPKMDGLEVCRLLKFSAETRHIPILMLTAKSSEVDQIVGFELGASDYLTKPFSVKVLLARVKNLLKNRARQFESKGVLSVDGFNLDRDRHSFDVKGREITLTRTEFRIMELLLSRPQIVITREQLVSSVWGPGALVSSAALNMQVKGLREKLGRQRDRIETVRGSGFRFSPS